MTTEQLNITREQFMAYEEIRQSGITNMFDSRTVIEESDGYLDKEAVSTIMKGFGVNYTKLVEMYPDVKDDVANGGGLLGFI
jgi:hypothetical protein